MAAYLSATLLTCGILLWESKRIVSFPVPGRLSAKQWLLLIFASAPLLIVSGARWGVGTDFFHTYLPEYLGLEWLRSGATGELAQELFKPVLGQMNRFFGMTTVQETLDYSLTVLSDSAPLFRIILELSVYLKTGFRGVMWLTSAIVEIAVFYCIFTESRNPVLAAFLYVAGGSFFLSLNIVRQFLAISICLLAIPAIRDGKPLRFFLLIAVAILFHSSAVVMLPCYLLRWVRVTPLPILVGTAVLLALSPAVSPVVEWLLPKLGLGYYLKYFGSDSPETEFEILFFAINLCYLALGAMCWKKISEQESLLRIWYYMTAAGTFFLALSGSLPLMKRLNFYYAAPQFLLLPELLELEEREKIKKIFTVVVILLFTAEMVISVMVFNKNGVLPYRVAEWY